MENNSEKGCRTCIKKGYCAFPYQNRQNGGGEVKEKHCPKCGSEEKTRWFDSFDSYYECHNCGFFYKAEDVKECNFFDYVTKTPETLAPKFVYYTTKILDEQDRPKKIWHTTLIVGESFETELKAQRATLAKLK